MLAQLNSKQKSLFFNIKPTVIDKLISKNKSSIQNSLLYTNEESDGSLSEDSEESSSSSPENSLLASVQHTVTMAPVRRSEKIVLGSKISSRSQFPLKRGPGRPRKNNVGSVSSNPKVIAAKRVLENSKRGTPKNIVKNVRSVVKIKRTINDTSTRGIVLKRSRSSLKNENLSSTAGSRPTTSSSETGKPTVTQRKPKTQKDMKTLDGNESSSPQKSSVNSQASTLTLITTKSSPRKFPSNVLDRWKSTGMVIRGRVGRPRGSSRASRGGASRGGFRRGGFRPERYNTRDSQIGLMRSGKRRKCSDPNLVEGLEGIRKRRRVMVKRLKGEKNDCPSDEHSSFVTTSELSFCDNDNSLKQSDDETVIARLSKVKVEIEETEDETTHPRDTNSNVFKNEKKIKKHCKTLSSGSDVNDQSNNSKLITKNIVSLGPKRFGRGGKRLVSLEKKLVSQSDSSVKDSDCSLDSDFTEDLTNSPKSGMKRNRRKGVDGLWVRRSTRSVGKNVDKAEPDAVVIEELLKEKDLIVDLDSNSKSSSNFDGVTSNNSSVQLVNVTDSVEKSYKTDSSSIAVIKTPVIENTNDNSFVDDCLESADKLILIADSVVKPDVKTNVDNETVLNDSLNDFTLTFEETPVKNSVDSIIEMKSEIPVKSLFGSPSKTDFSIIEPTFLADDNAILSSIINETSLEQTHTSTIKEIESENLSEIHTHQSNNICKLDDNIENFSQKDQITCLINLEKDDKTSNIDLTSKDESMDIFIDQVDEKLNEQGFSNREQISDENILSMIDSFCQSDSTDFSVDERMQESTASEKEDEKKIIMDSVNEMTSEVERTLLKESHSAGLLETRTSIAEINESHLLSNENSSEILTNSLLKDCTSESVSLKDEVNIETQAESVGDLRLSNASPPEKVKHLQISNCYENNIKMEDLECVDKAPESTEESSSSDSNSMSELMSAPIENDSGIITHQIIPDDHLAGDESRSEVLQTNTNQIDSDVILNSAQVCPRTQSGSFSSLVNTQSNNKVRETDREILCSKSMLVRTSNLGDSTEERPSKELLSALGLKPSVADEKPKRPIDSYTGTLKAVIKLNRSSDKRSGGRKMIFKQGDKLIEDSGGGGDRLEYRICSAEELSTEGVPLTHLADIPANRKIQIKVKSQFDLSSSPNIVGAAGSLETPTTSDSTKEPGGKQNLVIPEKSSSFSIHPERLCTDVCSYCFGKFGSLDTPCHLAQLKNSERQAKILAIEVHLSADSCLCDGCFRYVDRKANCPASQRSRKPAARRGPLAGTICAVQECTQPARHSVRRKWLIKLKKSIGKKLVIDMDKNPHLPFPLCSQHYYWVDYFTVCGICKKRLTRNHMYALGPEADELNQALSDDGIPVRLSDKLFLCKLCRYYSSLRLKYRDPAAMSSTHRLFLNSYRKKILHYHDIPVSESEEEHKSVEEEVSTSDVPKVKKKKSKSKSLDGHESKKRNSDKDEKSHTGNEDRSNDSSQMIDYSYLDTLNVHREEPTTPTVDYSSLADFEGEVGFSNIASFLNPLEGGQGTVYPSDSQNRSRGEKPTRIQVKFGNLNIGKLSNLNIGQDTRPSSSAATASERPPYLPGERDLKLSGEIEFHGTLNPSSSWERCTSTIQFDRDTKKLWQELQRPYGNQSSFLRHLLILEKHWRNGSLVLAENPNPRAVKYINSVRNRVQAYDGAKSSDVAVVKPKEPEVTVISPPPRPMSTPVKATTAPPPLMKIVPGSTPWLQDQLRRPPPYMTTVTSTQTSATSNRLMPVIAPPPYRFPSRPNQIGSRTIRLPAPCLTYTPTGRGQQNIRPGSISSQQFKTIRIDQPPVSMSQVTVIPKVEPLSETQSASSSASSDFVPLICDVRSLSTCETSDWNESFRKQQQKMLKQNVAKYYTPILPKIPHSLTVTTFPQTTALVMKTSSLTIEKAPNNVTKPNFAPPEKPSISVFRETTPSENC